MASEAKLGTTGQPHPSPIDGSVMGVKGFSWLGSQRVTRVGLRLFCPFCGSFAVLTNWELFADLSLPLRLAGLCVLQEGKQRLRGGQVRCADEPD